MPLVKLEDFYPDYRETSTAVDDIKNYDVYAQGDDKVGSVDDILVDSRDGRFRYFVVDTGFWIFGKRVLLPVGLANIDANDKRIYVDRLTKQQVEDLPNFDNLEKIDYEQEERVRNVYRPGVAPASTTAPTNRDVYDYDRDPDLYNISDRNQETLRLYEERLIATKQRQKTGEVSIGKHVETEQARVSVPVEKEHVVIERTAPTDARAVDPDNTAFRENDEVARMSVYEETPDIHKETVVREDVKVKKVTEHDTVSADETVRHEELDVNTEGRPNVDKRR